MVQGTNAPACPRCQSLIRLDVTIPSTERGVMFLPLSVFFLSVCEDYSESYDWIFMKFANCFGGRKLRASSLEINIW